MAIVNSGEERRCQGSVSVARQKVLSLSLPVQSTALLSDPAISGAALHLGKERSQVEDKEEKARHDFSSAVMPSPDKPLLHTAVCLLHHDTLVVLV